MGDFSSFQCFNEIPSVISHFFMVFQRRSQGNVKEFATVCKVLCFMEEHLLGVGPGSFYLKLSNCYGIWIIAGSALASLVFILLQPGSMSALITSSA